MRNGNEMRRRRRRVVLTLAACLALAGCIATDAPDGAYVALLREAMVESARHAEASDAPEPAVRAVGAWRTSDVERRDARGATPTGGAMQ